MFVLCCCVCVGGENLVEWMFVCGCGRIGWFFVMRFVMMFELFVFEIYVVIN